MAAGMGIEGIMHKGESDAGKLFTALRRIDALIQEQVRRARQQQHSQEQFQGLVISEKEVDELLSRQPGSNQFAHAEGERAPREAQTSPNGDSSRLETLTRLFHLTEFDLDCLLIALAPELDSRYERLYGYLQDDITKRWPSVDLILNLVCPDPNPDRPSAIL